MHIDCPSCGSKLKLQPAERLLKCSYCESMVRVELGESLPKMAFKAKVPPSMIPGLIKQFLKNNELNADFTINNFKLVYFPFWKFASSVRNQFSPAKTTTNAALMNYQVESGEIAFFSGTLMKEAIVHQPDYFLESAIQDLRENDQEDLAGYTVSMIYVPFYNVEFSYGEQTFTAQVFAHKSGVIINDLPGASAIILNNSLALTMVFILMVYFGVTFICLVLFKSFTVAIIGCSAVTLVCYRWLTNKVLKEAFKE